MSKGKTSKVEKKEPPAERKKSNLIYNIISYTITLVGVFLLILGQILTIDILFFISLGVLGLGIMLIVQKSVYKQTASTAETESQEDDDTGLQLRRRQ
ncbi:MAG: hypothetical protein ACTSQE_03230 [Candidatus Heimdallarchaeaceae archaeon]